MYGSLTALVFPKVWEQDRELVQEGAVLQAQGKLSFTENKEPELLADSLSPAPKEGQPLPRPHREGKPGLYLRLDSKEDPRYRKALQYTALFDEGRLSELYLTFRDSGKTFRAPARCRTAVNGPLLRALEKLLGRENVAFVGEGPGSGR